MTIRFEGVTIIGVGLLGASLGLALKKRGMAARVTGVGRRASSLDIALQRGAVDRATLDVAEGVSDAEAVIIATPAGLVTDMLDRALAAAPPTAILLDVASTKAGICDHARRVCPLPRRFVGCHPMAGAEVYGPEHGQEDFYCGAVCLVETDVFIDPDVRARVRALWEGVGARVVEVDARTHDAALARTSHAPHVTAAALARVACEHGAQQDMIGNGFRDATRIAASRAEIWRDICLENREALAETLADIRERLEEFESMLARDDAPGIEAFFQAGAEARRKVLES